MLAVGHGGEQVVDDKQTQGNAEKQMQERKEGGHAKVPTGQGKLKIKVVSGSLVLILAKKSIQLKCSHSI